LSEPEKALRQKLKTMVTDPARVRRSDPGDPDKCPVGDLHKIFSDAGTMAKVYEGCRTAGIGCIECKGWAADNLWKVLAPIQERRATYEANPSWLGTFWKQARRRRVTQLKQRWSRRVTPPIYHIITSRRHRAQAKANSIHHRGTQNRPLFTVILSERSAFGRESKNPYTSHDPFIDGRE
jgi:hypothetical protein